MKFGLHSLCLWLLFLDAESAVPKRFQAQRDWRDLVDPQTLKYSESHYESHKNLWSASNNVAEADIRTLLPLDEPSGQVFFNAILMDTEKWPFGVLPYVFDDDFSKFTFAPAGSRGQRRYLEFVHGTLSSVLVHVKTSDNQKNFRERVLCKSGWSDRDLIHRAMHDISARTCVRFAEGYGYLDSNDYVLFRKTSDTCSSYVGLMGTGEQVVSLAPGCLQKIGEVQHEILHALGFYHEQNRMDRDVYVDVLWENIAAFPGADMKMQFDKHPSNDFGLPYDYESIMHYGHNYFSMRADLPTVLPKSWKGRQKIGNREMMTKTDAQKVNLLYKCPGTKATTGRPIPVSATTKRTTSASRATESPMDSAQICSGRKCLTPQEVLRLGKAKQLPANQLWRLFKLATKVQADGKNVRRDDSATANTLEKPNGVRPVNNSLPSTQSAVHVLLTTVIFLHQIVLPKAL